MKRLRGATEVFEFREASFERTGKPWQACRGASEPASFFLREVDPAQQLPESGGGGDAEVVTHEEAHLGTGHNRTEQRFANGIEPRGLHERREEVDLARPRKPVGEPMPERAIGPRGEREPRRLFGGDWWPRQIISLLRDHMPHATTRVGHVAGIARDHVDMHVRHGLAGGRAAVEADVVAIGLGIKALVQQPLRFPDEVDQRLLLFRRALEECRHHPPRDHEHMPRRHREAVEDRQRQFIRAHPLRRGDGKERRGGSGIHGRKFSCPWKKSFLTAPAAAANISKTPRLSRVDPAWKKVTDDFFPGHPSPTRSCRPSEVTAEVPQTDRRPDR